MMKKGRFLVLASWLVVRLHGMAQWTATPSRRSGLRQTRYSRASGLVSERWCFEGESSALLQWQPTLQRVQFHPLPDTVYD